MIKRTYLLFAKYGIELIDTETLKYSEIFNQSYEYHRRAIHGAKELLKVLRKTVRVGIVTNGFYERQIDRS